MCLYVLVAGVGWGRGGEMKYVTDEGPSQLEERKCVFSIHNSFSIKSQKTLAWKSGPIDSPNGLARTPKCKEMKGCLSPRGVD